jgi:hypothetical protein
LKTLKQWLYNILVITSQFISVILLGHPDESISQRTGRAYLQNPTGYFALQLKVIDFIVLVTLGEKNHCLKSLNGEAHAKEIWDWGGVKKIYTNEELNLKD